MFNKLIPWKKKNGDVKIWKEEDHPVVQLRHEFDRLWDRFWDDWRGGVPGSWQDSRWMGSRIDLHDAEKEFVLRAELPGFEPGDFDIKVSGNVLTLRAEHKEEGKQKNGSYRSYGSYVESFTLPQGIQADQIDARYRNGVLEVHLPKNEEFQGKRIEVKAG